MRGIVFLLILNGICIEVTGQLPPEDPHWRLVFEEQFDSIDPSFWKVANDFDHYGEPQVYTNRPENVFVENGELILQIRKESYRCRELGGGACNKPWYDYTSGWIETRHSLDIRYGYLESRIKIPHGFGFWPAFWTFVAEGVRKSNMAEIDIFEMLGTQPGTLMGTNLHLAYCKCSENSCNCEYLNDMMCPEVDPDILCHQLDVEIPDYTESYHTYGLEWTPSKIIWYVNGNMVRNSANPGIVDPVRVIFNLAITPWNSPNDTTPFPSSMRIDYLKFFQLETELASINSLLRDTITLGGEENIHSIPLYTSVTFRAREEILIEGDFFVPLGAELYLDVNKSQ